MPISFMLNMATIVQSPKNCTFKIKITDIGDALFIHGLGSDDAKYKDFDGVPIEYMQYDYSAGVKLGKSIQYGKVPTLALPDNPTNQNNNSDTEFYMGVFEWRENPRPSSEGEGTSKRKKEAVLSIQQ